MGSDLSAEPPSDDKLAQSQEEIAKRHAVLAAKFNALLPTPQLNQNLKSATSSSRTGLAVVDPHNSHNHSGHNTGGDGAGTRAARMSSDTKTEADAPSRRKTDVQGIKGVPLGQSMFMANVLNPKSSAEAAESTSNTASLSTSAAASNADDDVMPFQGSAAGRESGGGGTPRSSASYHDHGLMTKHAGGGQPMASWQQALAGSRNRRGSKNSRSQVAPEPAAQNLTSPRGNVLATASVEGVAETGDGSAVVRSHGVGWVKD